MKENWIHPPKPRLDDLPATNFRAVSLNAAYTRDLDLEDTLTARRAFAIEKFLGKAKRGDSERFLKSVPAIPIQVNQR
jgi:hypothetical protein